MQKQKGFILPIVIAVVVIALLGGAGYFVYQNYSAPKTEWRPAVADNIAGHKNSRSSITVVTPNGGETFIVGQTMNIAWTSMGLDSSKLLQLFLERKSPTDSQYWNIKTVAALQPQSGSYNWIIPSDIFFKGAFYKIVVAEHGESGLEKKDESDNYFSITSTDQTVGWKTYRNDEYGFEIRYPDLYLLKEKEGGGHFIIGQGPPNAGYGLIMPAYSISIENNISSFEELRIFMENRVKSLATGSIPVPEITFENKIIAGGESSRNKL